MLANNETTTPDNQITIFSNFFDNINQPRQLTIDELEIRMRNLASSTLASLSIHDWNTILTRALQTENAVNAVVYLLYYFSKFNSREHQNCTSSSSSPDRFLSLTNLKEFFSVTIANKFNILHFLCKDKVSYLSDDMYCEVLRFLLDLDCTYPYEYATYYIPIIGSEPEPRELLPAQVAKYYGNNFALEAVTQNLGFLFSPIIGLVPLSIESCAIQPGDIESMTYPVQLFDHGIGITYLMPDIEKIILLINSYREQNIPTETILHYISHMELRIKQAIKYAATVAEPTHSCYHTIKYLFSPVNIKINSNGDQDDPIEQYLIKLNCINKNIKSQEIGTNSILSTIRHLPPILAIDRYLEHIIISINASMSQIQEIINSWNSEHASHCIIIPLALDEHFNQRTITPRCLFTNPWIYIFMGSSIGIVIAVLIIYAAIKGIIEGVALNLLRPGLIIMIPLCIAIFIASVMRAIIFLLSLCFGNELKLCNRYLPADVAENYTALIHAIDQQLALLEQAQQSIENNTTSNSITTPSADETIIELGTPVAATPDNASLMTNPIRISSQTARDTLTLKELHYGNFLLFFQQRKNTGDVPLQLTFPTLDPLPKFSRDSISKYTQHQ